MGCRFICIFITNTVHYIRSDMLHLNFKNTILSGVPHLDLRSGVPHLDLLSGVPLLDVHRPSFFAKGRSENSQVI